MVTHLRLYSWTRKHRKVLLYSFYLKEDTFGIPSTDPKARTTPTGWSPLCSFYLNGHLLRNSSKSQTLSFQFSHYWDFISTNSKVRTRPKVRGYFSAFIWMITHIAIHQGVQKLGFHPWTQTLSFEWSNIEHFIHGLKRFHLDGHHLGLYSRTQKLESLLYSFHLKGHTFGILSTDSRVSKIGPTERVYIATFISMVMF